MAEEDESSLEFTPTWVVALVCTIIVTISLLVERCIHYGGKCLKRKNQKALFEALQIIKEELMLLGFISLMLTVLQGVISKICIPKRFVIHMLPCERKESTGGEMVEHVGRLPRMLLEMEESQHHYCARKGEDKVPFLSVEALHHLHIFIFVLAVVHVTFSVLTIIFGGARIRQWKQWEDDLAKENNDIEQDPQPKYTHVQEHAFIQLHSGGVDGHSGTIRWVKSFFKQFYGAVTKVDYVALRFGFIMNHCKSNLKFNFHKYMIRALEDDFKHVVGISWYLWVFVIIFLLLNVNGWHTYFWIAFIPFILLLTVGAKLEHVITQLAKEVSDKHAAIVGELVVKPSDEHFWFNRPQIILFFIHFILFQNAFEIAFFFWIWVQFGFDSCIMGQVRFIVPRLIIGVIIQVLCSYSTLPLYAIVTQMGSAFKKAIFEEDVHAGILGWHAKVKNKKKGFRGSVTQQGSTTSTTDGPVSIQLERLLRNQNEGNEAPPATSST